MMSRIILTFENLHQVLAAEKSVQRKELESRRQAAPLVRTTPTPPGLSASICGISLEVLAASELKGVLHWLESEKLAPSGVHELD